MKNHLIRELSDFNDNQVISVNLKKVMLKLSCKLKWKKYCQLKSELKLGVIQILVLSYWRKSDFCRFWCKYLHKSMFAKKLMILVLTKANQWSFEVWLSFSLHICLSLQFMSVCSSLSSLVSLFSGPHICLSPNFVNNSIYLVIFQ